MRTFPKENTLIWTGKLCFFYPKPLKCKFGKPPFDKYFTVWLFCSFLFKLLNSNFKLLKKRPYNKSKNNGLVLTVFFVNKNWLTWLKIRNAFWTSDYFHIKIVTNMYFMVLLFIWKYGIETRSLIDFSVQIDKLYNAVIIIWYIHPELCVIDLNLRPF